MVFPSIKNKQKEAQKNPTKKKKSENIFTKCQLSAKSNCECKIFLLFLYFEIYNLISAAEAFQVGFFVSFFSEAFHCSSWVEQISCQLLCLNTCFKQFSGYLVLDREISPRCFTEKVFHQEIHGPSRCLRYLKLETFFAL